MYKKLPLFCMSVLVLTLMFMAPVQKSLAGELPGGGTPPDVTTPGGGDTGEFMSFMAARIKVFSCHDASPRGKKPNRTCCCFCKVRERDGSVNANKKLCSKTYFDPRQHNDAGGHKCTKDHNNCPKDNTYID